MDLQVGGSSKFKVDKTGIVTAQSAIAGSVGWFTSGITLGTLTGGDTSLVRDAAHIFAQRNGTNAQAFRIYGTYTDASNYTRGAITVNTNGDTYITAQSAGTGYLYPSVGIQGKGGGIFSISHDNVLRSGNSLQLELQGRTRLVAPSQGVLTLSFDSGVADFARLQFGGTTSSFPALKRSAAALQARLADDSNYADFTAWSVTAYGGFNIAGDTLLYRDAADVFAMRRSTNANALRIYNTYTDASNYERGFAQWSSNVFWIGAEAAGTGAARHMRVGPNGTGAVILFRTGGSDRWQMDGNGHLITSADNTYDIGASGATRPRNIYAAGVADVGSVLASGALTAGSSSFVRWNSRAYMASPADGIITLSNAAVNDFTRLQFGGTTSSFPAIKRSAAALHVRLADDSDFTFVQGKLQAHANATAETITPTHTVILYDGAGVAYKVAAVAA